MTHGVISATDVVSLKESQDFLLRVRNEMHFATGKHQDQLTFEQQEKVSEALGFESEGTLRGVEVFMRAYYLHAMQISRLSELIVHRVTDCDKPRFTDKLAFGRTLREGVRISKGHLTPDQTRGAQKRSDQFDPPVRRWAKVSLPLEP